MPSYKATFSNGKTKSIANSKREYKVAWLFTVIGGNADAQPVTMMGFAKDFEHAQRAIQIESRHWINGNLRPQYPGDKIRLPGRFLHTEIVTPERKD